MAKIETSLTIDRPAEEVWKFMTDFSNAKKKDPNVIEARYTSSGPPGVGTTAELVYPKQTVSVRVLEYEENRKLTLEFTSGPIRGTTTTFVFEPAEGKTKVTRTDDVKAAGFYKLMGAMVTSQVRKVSVDDLANTKRALESEPKAPKVEV